MKRVCCATVLTVCILVLGYARAACGQRFDDASFEGRAYTNRFFGFRYTLPDGFKSASFPSSPASSPTLLRLIAAADGVTRQSAFVLAAEGAPFNDANSAERALRRFADAVATNYEVVKPAADARYGGRPFFSFTVRTASYFGLINITTWRGYTLGFLFTAPSEAELDTLAVSLDGLDFFGPETPLPPPGAYGSGMKLATWSTDTPPDCPDGPASGAQMERVPISPETAAKLAVYRVAPTYPPLARTAGIQGEVVLAVVIGCSGAVREVRLESGPPMLAPAAVHAVRQWRYKPYMLNGQAVEVETNVTVRFTLQ